MFSGFYGGHLDEALTIIKYLWKNPVSYIELKYAVPEPVKPPSLFGSIHYLISSAKEAKRPSTEVARGTFGGVSFGTFFLSLLMGVLGADWGEEEIESKFEANPVPVWNQGGQSQATAAQVDLGATKEALRLARETEQLGVQTLATLAVQGGMVQIFVDFDFIEQIDRIEGKIDAIHIQLDRYSFIFIISHIQKGRTTITRL